MIDFRILPVSTEELEKVLEIYRQCEDFLALGPTAQASMEMVRQDIALSQGQAGCYCGIYAVDGQMLGVLDYIPAGFEGFPERAFIELLMIAASYRRAGLGGAVVRWLEQQIFQNPAIACIEAGVQVNNPPAIRFWKRNGYTIVSGAELQPDGTVAYRLRRERPPAN